MDGQLLNIFADFVRGIWELLKADSVFFPFVAVSIALGLSIAELLQKYPDRTARELFLSSTFLAFLGVNAIVCLVVYLLLPNIADLFAASDGKSADWVSHLKTDGWLRALVAGFGYLTVARAKIIEFKGPGGASIPIGFELLYNAFTNWLISKHVKRLNARLQDDLMALHREIQSPIPYLMAAAFVRPDVSDQQDFDGRLSIVKSSTGGKPEICGGVYRVLCRECYSRERAAEIVRYQYDLLKNDPTLGQPFVNQGWPL